MNEVGGKPAIAKLPRGRERLAELNEIDPSVGPPYGTKLYGMDLKAVVVACTWALIEELADGSEHKRD
jgi:hypothetical protein